MDVSLQRDMESGEDEQKIDISPDAKLNYLEVHRDQQYTLVVGTKRKNHSQSLKAHCPRFHRGKDEGWFLVLGDVDNRELLALKRISGVNGPRKVHYLQFVTPPNQGKLELTLPLAINLCSCVEHTRVPRYCCCKYCFF